VKLPLSEAISTGQTESFETGKSPCLKEVGKTGLDLGHGIG
jgi:hypothetical protein